MQFSLKLHKWLHKQLSERYPQEEWVVFEAAGLLRVCASDGSFGSSWDQSLGEIERIRDFYDSKARTYGEIGIRIRDREFAKLLVKAKFVYRGEQSERPVLGVEEVDALIAKFTASLP